jgi:hypothetical protein
MPRSSRIRAALTAALVTFTLSVGAQPADPAASESLASALTPQQWTQVEQSIDRALAWLAKQQDSDGSIDAPVSAQPAATSLTVMAYLSKGHVPGQGPYGRVLDKAIDFVLRTQQPDGVLAYSGGGEYRSTSGKTANYNHAIAGLMLTEVYGMTDRARAARLKPAIVNALNFTRKNQTLPKQYPGEQGGWRYLYSDSWGESDLSVTAWQLMFLRSAKNAEFDIPKQYINEAIGFVNNCWDENQGVFYYRRAGSERRFSRGMVGAGVLSLAMAGEHDKPMAQRAGDWLLRYPFQRFGERIGSGDRFFYSTYYCSQAMAQLGGRHWKQFFPNLARVLVQSQQGTGEWPPESGGDRMFGNTYTTAMAVLSLTPPLQLLPVYQR